MVRTVTNLLTNSQDVTISIDSNIITIPRVIEYTQIWWAIGSCFIFSVFLFIYLVDAIKSVVFLSCFFVLSLFFSLATSLFLILPYIEIILINLSHMDKYPKDFSRTNNHGVMSKMKWGHRRRILHDFYLILKTLHYNTQRSLVTPTTIGYNFL